MDLKPKNWKAASFDFFNSLYAGAALMIVAGIAATLYTRFGATWERPIINGLVTAAVVASLFLAIRAFLSMPPATAKTTPENVGGKILTWLHRFNLMVQTRNEPDCDFFYKVVTEGQKIICVKRELKYHPDYITITGSIVLTDEQKELLKEFSELETFDASYAIKVELLRAQFGHDSTDVLGQGLVIFHRIPITANLAETDVIDGIWRMEAILGLVMNANLRTEMHFRAKKKEVDNETRVSRGEGSTGEFQQGNEEDTQNFEGNREGQTPSQDEE